MTAKIIQTPTGLLWEVSLLSRADVEITSDKPVIESSVSVQRPHFMKLKDSVTGGLNKQVGKQRKNTLLLAMGFDESLKARKGAQSVRVELRGVPAERQIERFEQAKKQIEADTPRNRAWIEEWARKEIEIANSACQEFCRRENSETIEALRTAMAYDEEFLKTAESFILDRQEYERKLSRLEEIEAEIEDLNERRERLAIDITRLRGVSWLEMWEKCEWKYKPKSTIHVLPVQYRNAMREEVKARRAFAYKSKRNINPQQQAKSVVQ